MIKITKNQFSFVVLLGLLSVLFQCNDTSNKISNITTEISIPLANEANIVIKNNEDILKLANEIKLETAQECLITTIRDVSATDSYIIVIDENDPLPMLFDYHGRFIRKIGKKGRGPGEIDDNKMTIVTDSTILVLTSSFIINEYTLEDKYIGSINLEEDYLLCSVFHHYRNSLYVACQGRNSNHLILGKINLQKNELKDLYSLSTKEEEYNHSGKFIIHRQKAVFNKDEAYLFRTNEYKIHYWKADVYQGYFTNEYHKYHFFNDYSFTYKYTFQEFQNSKHYEGYRTSDKIDKIFVLDNNYLLVDIFSLDGAKIANESIGKVKVYHGFIGFNDLIDIKNKIIYSQIPKLISHFVGSYKDQIISWKPNFPIDPNKREELQNPTILFYKLNSSILNKNTPPIPQQTN